MPDISSFIVSHKNQTDMKELSGRTTTKKKTNRARRQSSDFQEEVMPTTGSSTRARKPPGGNNTGNSSAAKAAAVGPSHDVDGVYIIPEGKELKVVYPHKKYQVSNSIKHSLASQMLTISVTFDDRQESSSCSTGKSSSRSIGTPAVIGASRTSISCTAV